MMSCEKRGGNVRIMASSFPCELFGRAHFPSLCLQIRLTWPPPPSLSTVFPGSFHHLMLAFMLFCKRKVLKRH